MFHSEKQIICAGFPSLEGLFHWSIHYTEGALNGEIFIQTDPY
jgi:hypothetical protein